MAVRLLTGTSTAIEADELDDDQLRELYAVPRTPWLRVNMVSTVDGAAAGEDGRTGAINNAADHRVFGLLRRMSDVIIVGAGTARAEGYRPTGRPLVVVSRRGAVPPQLLDAEPGRVLLATCATAEGLHHAREELGDGHVLVLGTDAVDLAELKVQLAERGFERLHSEGGPQLLRDMLAAGVVDELCATFVPRMIAGHHIRMTTGGPVDVPLDLRLLLEEDGTLLGRWFT